MKNKILTTIITSAYLIMSVAISSAQTRQTQNNKLKFEATFAGKKSGAITVKELLSDSILRFAYEDTLTPYKYKVVSFKVSIIPHLGRTPILDIPSEGGKMSERARSLIKDLQKGDKIFFEYISAELDTADWNDKAIPKPTVRNVRPLEPLALTIADE